MCRNAKAADAAQMSVTADKNVTNRPPVAVKTFVLTSQEKKIAEEPQTIRGQDVSVTLEHSQYVSSPSSSSSLTIN